MVQPLCPDCRKRVSKKSNEIFCKICNSWFHLKCQNVLSKQKTYLCVMCALKILPFCYLDCNNINTQEGNHNNKVISDFNFFKIVIY